MEASGFLTKHPAGRWNQSLGPKPQLFLLSGSMVWFPELAGKEKGQGKNVVAGEACLLFGEVQIVCQTGPNPPSGGGWEKMSLLWAHWPGLGCLAAWL